MATTPPFRIDTIDHIVLRAVDVARLRDFYCQVLGCRIEREQPDIGLLQLRAGDALIDLVDIHSALGGPADSPPSHATRNLEHFCLRVEPFDANVLEAYLKAGGVSVGTIGDRFGATGTGPSIYLEDPEGNRIELKARGACPL